MNPISPAAMGLCGFGLVLHAPRSWEPGVDTLADASAAADHAEGAGISSLWVEEPAAGPPGVVPYEAFSLLGALATRTTSIHLGIAADQPQRRAPSVLAKIVTGVDVISHGRAVLSLDGTGTTPVDAARLAEALAVTRSVLEDEVPTVEGRIYSVAGAVNRPAPVQTTGVPLVVFLGARDPSGEVLEVCARRADAVVVKGGAREVGEVLTYLGGRRGPRDPEGERAAVLGYVAAGDGVAGSVSAVRDAGADGCLAGVPAPWSAPQVGGSQLRW